MQEDKESVFDTPAKPKVVPALALALLREAMCAVEWARAKLEAAEERVARIKLGIKFSCGLADDDKYDTSTGVVTRGQAATA